MRFSCSKDHWPSMEPEKHEVIIKLKGQFPFFWNASVVFESFPKMTLWCRLTSGPWSLGQISRNATAPVERSWDGVSCGPSAGPRDARLEPIRGDGVVFSGLLQRVRGKGRSPM